MDKVCETCKSWFFFGEKNGIQIGLCDKEQTEPENFKEDDFSSYPEGVVTGPKFGCIHWDALVKKEIIINNR